MHVPSTLPGAAVAMAVFVAAASSGVAAAADASSSSSSSSSIRLPLLPRVHHQAALPRRTPIPTADPPLLLDLVADALGAAHQRYSTAKDRSFGRSSSPSPRDTHTLHPRQPFAVAEIVRGSLFAEVQIGSPPQTFRLDCDTGSAVLWVACQSCESCPSSSATFDYTASSSFQFEESNDMNSSITISYATGSVTGIPVSDNVVLAGLEAAKQPFLLVTDEDSVMANQLRNAGDGILGLTYNGGLSSDSNSLLNALAAQNQFPEHKFSIWFNQSLMSSSQSTDEYGGLIIFGNLDSSLYNGSVKYSSVVSVSAAQSDNVSTDMDSFFWAIRSHSIVLNGTSSSSSSSSSSYSQSFASLSSSASPSADGDSSSTTIQSPDNMPIVIDSGTSLILVDSGTLASFINHTITSVAWVFSNDSGIYSLPCSNVSLLPVLTFVVGEDKTPLSLEPADYIITDGSMCVLAIQSVGSIQNKWVFGQVLLRLFYTVFDFENAQVGFAAAAGRGASIDSVVTAIATASSGEATGGYQRRWSWLPMVVLLAVVGWI
ncbi:hypothetical protein HDU82_006014 [Entophlyctis luteolus]|nr:hypothetical protein HDU82_006014 [Entophlyctis luteolus]